MSLVYTYILYDTSFDLVSHLTIIFGSSFGFDFILVNKSGHNFAHIMKVVL